MIRLLLRFAVPFSAAMAILASGLCLSAVAAPCGNPDFAADSFIERWNAGVASLTTGTWHLEKYGGLGFIRQNLDGSSLVLSAQVDKNKCITQIQIRSLRAGADKRDAYAGLVSWVKLIRSTNPKITAKEQDSIFDKLGLSRPAAGGSISVNKVTYEFAEDADTNLFTSRPE